MSLSPTLSEHENVLEIQVSLSSTLSEHEKVEHHIRIKTHKLIVLRFWVKSDVSPLYEIELMFHWCCITLVILSQKLLIILIYG